VLLGFGPDGAERLEVEILDVDRRRFQDHLELVELLCPVRVVAVTTVGRAARRLDEGNVPGFGPEGAEERSRVVRPRPHLGIVRLYEEAAVPGPEGLEGEDEVLEMHARTA
jgi:hypothetical protein